MVDFKADFRTKTTDGKDRSHVPETPIWVAALRVAQLVLAFILMVLCAVASSQFRSDLAGLALCFFSFVWTVLYLGWLGFSLWFMPEFYHWLAHIIVEVLTNIFWLCTWAVLASEASAFDAEVRTINDLFDAFTSSESNSPFSSAVRNVRTAINCIKAAAALGALLWVLFIVSTVFLAMAVVAHYKATDGGGLGLKGRPRIGRPMEMNTVSAGAAGQPVEVPGAQPPAAGYYAPQQNQQYQHQQQPPPQQPQQPYSSA